MLVKIWHVKLKSHAFLILFATFTNLDETATKKRRLKKQTEEKSLSQRISAQIRKDKVKKTQKNKVFPRRTKKHQNSKPIFIIPSFFDVARFFCLFFCNLQENTKNLCIAEGNELKEIFL